MFVNFDTNEGCNTYEISYSTNISMKDAKSLFMPEDGVKIYDAQPGNRYYVRVREIRNDSCGNLVKGDWSYIRSIVAQ